jgi:hypothetical protein
MENKTAEQLINESLDLQTIAKATNLDLSSTYTLRWLNREGMDEGNTSTDEIMETMTGTGYELVIAILNESQANEVSFFDILDDADIQLVPIHSAWLEATTITNYCDLPPVPKAVYTYIKDSMGVLTEIHDGEFDVLADFVLAIALEGAEFNNEGETYTGWTNFETILQPDGYIIPEEAEPTDAERSYGNFYHKFAPLIDMFEAYASAEKDMNDLALFTEWCSK